MKGVYIRGRLQCSLFVIILYLIIVCLIYNCIVGIKNWSDFSVTKTSRPPPTRVQKDVYRLTWNPKDKVFYKKIRSPKRIQKQINKIKKDDSISDGSLSYVKITDDFYIFSAFHDKRLSTPYVRMIATFKRYSERTQTFWCHFRTNNKFVYFSSKLVYYEMCENHKRAIGGWIVSCIVPKEVTYSVSELWISKSSGYQNSSDTVRVKIANYESVGKENGKAGDHSLRLFGICVPPIYGTVEAKSFVEFIEFAKLLGVYKVVFYTFEIQDEISKILDYYKLIGFVDIIQWKLPFHHKYIWNYGQSLAANDCLYRHKADIDYLAFLDIDEILIPRNGDKTLGELVHTLESIHMPDADSVSGFTFRSTFFDPEFSKYAEYNEAKAVVRTNRTARFSHFRNKVLVRPARVFEVGIHHISRSWPDYKNYSVAKTDPNVAAVYHYRTCMNEFGIDCTNIIVDRTVSVKYGQQLNDNVMATMMKIV